MLDDGERLFDAWTLTKSKYRNCSPNYALINQAISYAKENGYKYYDLGVTSKSQEGLLEFKAQWGAEHQEFYYYYITVTSNKIPELDVETSFKLIRKIIRLIPKSLLKVLSNIFARHFA